MIRLQRPAPPSDLTTELLEELTERFEATAYAGWRREDIIALLLASSHSKCAYCESSLEPFQGMEVDHFDPKGSRPELALDWNNLVPSCRRCNGRKATHNVVLYPIINPYDVEPRDHLALNGTRLVGRTALGEMTLAKLPLQAFAVARYLLIIDMQKLIHDLRDDLVEVTPPLRPRKASRFQDSAEAILRSGTPQKAYSAVVARALLDDEIWKECVEHLERLELWTDEHAGLLAEVHRVALPRYVTARPATSPG